MDGLKSTNRCVRWLLWAVAPSKTGRFGWVIVPVAFWFSGEAQVQAYLDPGTGNVLIQAALSLLVGVMIWGRHLLGRMGDLFRRSNKQSPDDGNRDV
jgi:hypothetical protein